MKIIGYIFIALGVFWVIGRFANQGEMYNRFIYNRGKYGLSEARYKFFKVASLSWFIGFVLFGIAYLCLS